MTKDDNDIIDRSKLTQRELLLLLADKVDAVRNDTAKISDNYIGILVRVVKIETRMQVIAAAWGAIGVMITIIINLLK